MSTATTTTKRRAKGARQAVNGTSGNVTGETASRRRGDTETRGLGENDSGGPVRVSMGRRFVMRGHTVKIVNPREGWECMKGSYATVLTTFVPDGSVLVEMTRPGRDTKEKCCFSTDEIEMVPMGDPLRHADTEEYRLISRSVALYQMLKWGGPDGQPLSEALMAAVMRRSKRLEIPVRDIQRIARHDLRWQAAMTAMGLSNFCTALVPYTGGTH
jgi:hypothetical protein